MSGKIVKFLATPVVVNEQFLRSVDDTLHKLDDDLISRVCAHRGVSRAKLLKLRDNTSGLRSVEDRYSYEVALSYISSKYTITWDDDLKLEEVSLEECLRALNSESASPTQVEASIGSYGDLYASVSVRNKMFNIIFVNLVGPVSDIRNVLHSLKSNIENSPPEFRFLHHGSFKLVLMFGLIAIASIFLAILGYRFGAGGARNLFDDVSYIDLISMIIGGSVGGYAPKLYAEAFPGAVFEFGAGNRYKLKKKIVFGLSLVFLSSIIIPAFRGS